MINYFHNNKYSIWQIDTSKFKSNTVFYNNLNSSFEISSKLPLPQESNGLAYSVPLDKIPGFLDLLDVLSPSLNENFALIYGNQDKKIFRAWANRMHRDSFGSLHQHNEDVKVLIFYYNVPENSSDLIFVHPKYKNKNILNPYLLPDEDKLNIKVTEGMCILHDGEILHAVSKHNSDTPRDCVIIEYKLNNLNKS
jgi:hypothetical protein